MGLALAGLAASIVLYVAGATAFVALERRVLRGAPQAWREHPAVEQRRGSAKAAAAAWMAGLALASFVLLLVDASPWFLVAWAAAIAVWWTVAELRGAKAGYDELRAADPGLPPLQQQAAARALRWSARWVMWLGILTIPVFVADTVVELV